MAGAPSTTIGRRRKDRPEPQRRTVDKRRIDGTVLEKVVLDPQIFGIEPNVAVLHQVVTAQLAAARKGTHSTRTRSEVSGGGSKPWRQKGTGRARQGSIRSPQWAGGGIALGPKPRSYEQRTPKKMIRLALHSALSERASRERVLLVDDWTFEEPRTKDAIAALEALGVWGRVLIVLGPDDGIADRSFANLQRVQTVQVEELNAYDLVRSDWVVFSDSTLLGETEVVPGSGLTAKAERPASASKSASPRTKKTSAVADEEHEQQHEPLGESEPEAPELEDADDADEEQP